MAERVTRNVPMEVIDLGLCRTGTQSFCDAVEMLGYGAGFHMREVMKNHTLDFWIAKIHKVADGGDGPHISAADLDRHTTDFRACADVPISVFPEELLDAYPDAKVVLTTRAPDTWVRSMNTSILAALQKGNEQAPPDMVNLREAMERLWDNDIDKNGEAYFVAHNQKARDAAARRGRKVLEIDVSKPDSFDRLCEFLGKERPEGVTTFPHTDALAQFRKAHGLGGYAKDKEASEDWNRRMAEYENSKSTVKSEAA